MAAQPDPAKEDKVKALQAKADEVSAVMRANIDAAISRGMTLEEIEMKSKELDDQAARMRDGSRQVRRMFCRRNAKLIALISGFALVIIIIIIVAATADSS